MMATSTLCTPWEYFKIERKLSLTLARRDESRHEGAHFEERKEKIPKMMLAEQFKGVTSLTCFTLSSCVTRYGITVVTCSCPSSTFLQDVILRMSLKKSNPEALKMSTRRAMEVKSGLRFQIGAFHIHVYVLLVWPIWWLLRPLQSSNSLRGQIWLQISYQWTNDCSSPAKCQISLQVRTHNFRLSL